MKNITLIAAFVILVIGNISNAQLEKKNDNDKRQFRMQIDTLMKQKLMEKLDMSESTADKYVSAFRENNNRIKELMKEKKAVMKSIEADPEAADIITKLDKAFDIDSRIIETRRAFIKDISTYLTPQQIAKSMILKKNFNREFKDQIRKHKSKDNFRKRNKD
ncbi:MAG: hypothetical protein JST15_07060 [Bacteroidetes bacterium]|nr:hypothetical protein [Bacteroidota bacterium]